MRFSDVFSFFTEVTDAEDAEQFFKYLNQNTEDIQKEALEYQACTHGYRNDTFWRNDILFLLENREQWKVIISKSIKRYKKSKLLWIMQKNL
jgi:hypothetical protein